MTPAYWSDMAIVDKRLTKLEKDYAKIIKLLDDLTNELSKINGDGGKSNGIKEEAKQGRKRKGSVQSNRTVEDI
jgi:hypothetical protein